MGFLALHTRRPAASTRRNNVSLLGSLALLATLSGCLDFDQFGATSSGDARATDQAHPPGVHDYGWLDPADLAGSDAMPDLAVPDLVVPDLVANGGLGDGTALDLAIPPDLALLPDLPDLAPLADLPVRGDLAGLPDSLPGADLTAPSDLSNGPDLALPNCGFAFLGWGGAGTMPAGVALGDFDGDGNLDVASVNQGNAACAENNCGMGQGNLLVYRGDGKGSIEQVPHYSFGPSPLTIVLAVDLNGDQRSDLIVGGGGKVVYVLIGGKGKGDLQMATSLALAATPYSIALGDLDADGKLDLIASEVNPALIEVMRGNGDGSFDAPRPWGLNPEVNPRLIATGLLNTDKLADVAVSFINSNGNLNALESLISGPMLAFKPVNAFSSLKSEVTGLLLRDLNGDGMGDLAAALSVEPIVALGKGDGTFGAPLSLLALPIGSHTLTGIASGDLNGDGKADLVTSDRISSSITVYGGDGAGGFAPVRWCAVGPNPRQVVLGDLNNNGRLDVITIDQGDSGFTFLLN